MNPILAQLGSMAISMGVGWAGKTIGNGPKTGHLPWGKVLAPAVVVGASYGMTALTGLQVTPIDILGQGLPDSTLGAGGEVAAQSMLLFELSKNAVQFLRAARKPADKIVR